jgi:protein-disulfide isomerase
MERVVIAVALIVVATAVAAVLSRRRPDPPTQARVSVPRQLDRADFARPDAPWLVAVFTSTTCESCARATTAAKVFEGDAVAYEDIPWQTRRDLHDRYGITDVPLILIADADGVVQRSFVGAPSFADLEAAMSEARRPGSTGRPHVGELHLEVDE